jgi:hypothetical protein
MRRAVFGAVIGESRLLRSYDVLGWSMWGWTSVVGPDVSNIREVISTFGENIVTLCDIVGGGQAIYHSYDYGDTWSKVLEAADIYDITSVGFNWTLASTSAGWYSSLTSGSSWSLVAAAGEGVPVGKSVVWTLPDHLYAHDGAAIWVSLNKGVTWLLVCDLTTIPGYSVTKTYSIDGYQGRVIATCGQVLVETRDLGATWASIDLASAIRGWVYTANSNVTWRQICFWDTLDSSDPDKSKWVISSIIGDIDIIRTYVNRGTGIFSPVVDMALSDRHRLNVSATRRAGADITDHAIVISGDRRISGELRHAIVDSADGITFTDRVGADNQVMRSSAVMDKAAAILAGLAREGN